MNRSDLTHDPLSPSGKGDRGRPILVSLAVAIAFAILYAWALHRRHARYDTYAYDLGVFSQVAWNTLHGRWFETTILPNNYLADHLAPSLAILSPLFLIWPDAEVLLIVQAVAVAAAGVGVYLAARQKTGDAATALLLQVAYHLAPVTGWVVLDEFHPISLAMPAMAFATALLWAGRYRLAAGVGALALLANEDAALWLAPFGLLLAAAAAFGRPRPGALVRIVEGRREAVWGLAVTALAIVWLTLYMFVVIPAAKPAASHDETPPPMYIGVFAQCGQSIPEIVRCLVLDPAATYRRATTPDDRAALGTILGPTVGLSLLGPSVLTVLPHWFLLLLGNDPPNFKAHYAALLVLAAYLASAEAIGWRWWPRPAVRRLLALLVLGASLVAYYLGSPLPGGQQQRVPSPEARARVELIDRALQLIPRDPTVKVTSTSSIFPRVALRPCARLIFDGACGPDDYRILDLRDPYPIAPADLRRLAAIYRADAQFTTLFYEDDLLVLKREPMPPDRVVDAPFDRWVRLSGYSLSPAAGQVRLELYWQTAGAVPAPLHYHYFVHLAPESGPLYSQKDGDLAGGQLESSAWWEGAVLREEVLLPAPPPADWDRYHLAIGWYDVTSGQRLPLPDGRDHFVLPLEETTD